MPARNDKITPNELLLMQALRTAEQRYPVPDEWGHHPGELLEHGLIPADSSLPGIHQTAASLVRKGFAVRIKATRRALVEYRLTSEGTRRLAAAEEAAR